MRGAGNYNGVKHRIVAEALTMSAETAETRHKHGLSPNTFYPWRGRFLEATKAAEPDVAKAVQESDRPKVLLATSTLVADALKKPWKGGGRTSSGPPDYVRWSIIFYLGHDSN